MGFVKTPEELSRYYALGERVFHGAEMLGVMFRADPAVTARLLPPPLEQADLPGGLLFIARYPDTNLGPGYHEAALYLRCKYRGEPGSHCLSMPIDDEARMHNGRDIFGFPKRMATIHFEREGQLARGWVERKGVRFVELAVTLKGKLPAMPPMGPTYLFKATPRIDLQPGFDAPVLLCSQRTEVVPRSIEIGPAELTLRPSATDPWAELGDVKVMTAFYLLTDNTMRPGQVLGEVDAEAFLPHYFKMTDLYTGGDAPTDSEDAR